ncbi:PAS domain S-box-containing protein [Pararhizobium capsulatum DSM 1112]|uniref:histidine kinase n=1 Tax=Pararhizobium capsulatum DSM 1112 TaxID=1121113 RepID=A0ABU0C1B2_9HYPH|nr:PAS domain-containing protein [Pararhizobium capsulatum]MDQ0324002.1 PAS domain S-box-containing protein [Pararhizobium capsulatum DSM 1112]
MDVELVRVLETIPGMVFTAVPSGSIAFMNKGMVEFLGLSEPATSWPIAASSADTRALIQRWNSLVSGSEPFELTLPIMHSESGSQGLRLQCNPLVENDRVVKWYGVASECAGNAWQAPHRDTLPPINRETHAILESIPAGIGVLDANGNVDTINGHLLQYYGRTLDELRQWGSSDVVHPDDLPRLMEAVKLAVGTGTAYEAEVRLRRSDGRFRWFQIIGYPLENEKGGVARWYALHIDVEDRRRAEDALKSNELELRKIIDGMPLAVWTSRPDGYCDFVNERWLEYAGFTAEQAEGSAWTAILHPQDAGRLEKAWNTSLVSGDPADFEARMRGSDGEYRWFLFRATPLLGDDGKITKWYGTNIDIEDRKRAEQALAERERESRLIVDGIAGMIAIFSPDAQLIDGNRQILDYFERPLSELNDWSSNGITHPDDLQTCIDSFMGSMVTGEPYDYETRFLRHDGTWRWFQLRGLPLRTSEGEIVRWYGLLTDIDDRKRAEEKLRRNEAFLTDAQRLSKTGSFLLNLGTNEVTWSAETYRIFEVDPATPVTLGTVLSRLLPESLSTVQQVIDRANEGRGDFDYEILLNTPDQSLKYVRVLAHSERNKDGDPELIGAVQDITESRKAEEALNQARSDLSYVTRVTSLGVLTASIAHEVNQPLAGLVTNASTCLRVLTSDPPNIDVAKDTARRMIRDANRAADVISRLWDLFSRKPPSVEDVDLNEISGEVIALMSSDLQSSKVILTTDFATDLPRMTGARVQLQQVVMNLLRNSIEALLAVGDRPRRIVLKTDSNNGEIKLSIEDSGVGFGPQGSDRIFDAFYTTKPEGMGIGLSVSESIIKNHNGRLWAERNKHHGVTIGFSVPISLGSDLESGGMSGLEKTDDTMRK